MESIQPQIQTISRYEIVRELGRGGMAVVYLAYDPVMKRQVAIKVLPRQFTFDAQFRARFHREAEAIAALEHPAIVPVYDYGESDDQPYIVMRYMTGGSLADRLAQRPLTFDEITRIFTRLAAGLDAAHQRGMVHRDLKPGNILFDQWGEPYLSDFGIVKLTEATAGFTGSGLVGTPAYMSPEQAGGKSVDGRSDVYALAVILFQLLTHQLPFNSDTPIGQAVAHIVEPVPHILQINSALSPDTDAVIRKALAKNPDDRYPTAGALATAVSQALGDVIPPSNTIVHSTAIQIADPILPPANPPGRKRRSPLVYSSLAAIALIAASSVCLGTVLAGSRLFSTSTATPTASPTPTATLTATSTTASSATPSDTATPRPTPSDTPTLTQTATATPTATRTFIPVSSTPTLVPTPSHTPLPNCNPPEFFDPFLNRCRMPDQNNSGGGGGGGGGPAPTPVCPIDQDNCG